MPLRRPIVPLTPEQKRRVEKYLPLAINLARRMDGRVPNTAKGAHLYSDASLGLIQAAQRFNPDAGVTFATFASRRIWGAMRDGLRDKRFITRGAVARGETEPQIGSLSDVVAPQTTLGDLIEERFTDPYQRDAVRYQARGLNRHERQIIELYYVDGMEMRDIAGEMRLTESRVSQIHTQALQRMRERKE